MFREIPPDYRRNRRYVHRKERHVARAEESPVDTAIVGAYIHSVSGDIATGLKGMCSLVARGKIQSLPRVFRRIKNGGAIEFK